MSQNPPHRPLPELAPEMTEGIANLVRAGNRPVAAAMAKGIPERTFYRWMARGQAAEEQAQDGLEVPEDEVRFWQFRQRLTQAERESEVIAVSHLTKAMPSTPTAVLAWLERRFPRAWGRIERQQVEMTGPDGGPLETIDITAQVIERARKVRERLLANADTVTALPAPDKNGQ